jgi:DNA-binding ferritin-like protein
MSESATHARLPAVAEHARADERVRERAERLGEIDLVSQDVLIEVTRALERQLWMLRSEL